MQLPRETFASQIQHCTTHMDNSEINTENREAELWFLQHHHHLSHAEETISKEILTNNTNMIYSDADNKGCNSISLHIGRIRNRIHIHL